MDNNQFCKAISTSFSEYISSGTSRSTRKLVPLHSFIAKDLQQRLGKGYIVKSQGIDDGKEATVQGRYFNKKVDITIFYEDTPVAGIAVKFVMQNYSQNANNYFENMLGETANLRSEAIPYFQIFVIPNKLPYFNKDGKITKWENFTEHHIEKYLKLSKDDAKLFFHTPNKTLLFVVQLTTPEKENPNTSLNNRSGYLDYYSSNSVTITPDNRKIKDLGKSVIYNDYPAFIDKVFHTIRAR